MASNSQRSEGAEVSAIMKCYEAEWNNDKQNCLFVHMPTKQERSVATQCDCAYESFP